MSRQKKHLPSKIRKKQIPQLTYGIIHSAFGLADGVSIVMEQIEEVMREQMNIPAQNIKYFVGKSGKKSPNITTRKIIWHQHPFTKSLQKNYSTGFTDKKFIELKKKVAHAKIQIQKWVEKNNIDVIIAHNTCHPVNFICSLALSAFYDEKKNNGEKVPKYILWWHDSFLERERYAHPSEQTKELLYEGMPGPHVDYVMFINSLQYRGAQKYFKQLNERRPLYDHLMHKNHDVMYNTTSLFINTYEDLEHSKNRDDVDYFLEQFNVIPFLQEHNCSFDKTLFCLQHTRVVPRKRIDFALEYTFNLLYTLRKRGIYESMYFLISGFSGDETKKYRPKLERLHKQLQKKFNIKTHFLIFAEDFDKTQIPFEEYPRIFAKLGGISTYFSEIEGFGNNLLEVLASGLIPIVYTYPVFKSDIEKYNFKLIALDDFIVDVDSQLRVIDILTNQRKKKVWINRNLTILKKAFPHKIIKQKLTRAIIRKIEH